MVILASASPRRRELLGALGLEFEVVAPTVEEHRSAETPEALVTLNARAKARSAAADAPTGTTVIAADTEVFLQSHSLGKPETAAEARRHLESLSGRTHDVLTGLVILGPEEGQERQGVELSKVTFRDLDRALVDRYLASGEWRDRAGGYAIQGLGSTFVTFLAGDLSNVIGLPIGLLRRLAPELTEKSKPQV
jgi:septum formation protein